MSPVPPSLDQLHDEPDHEVVVTRKSRSSKHFFLASSARLAIGLGAIGVLGALAWLARDQLATAGLSAFLRSKGIEADVTVQNLQLDTAQIRDLRLGPVDKPSLLAKNTIVTWRVDSKAKLLIVERVKVDGVTLRVAIDKQGKPDFGALAPFLKPSTGPKQSVITRVDVSNAEILVDTPMGLGKAAVTLWGGEALGWTGRGALTPPATFMSAADAANFKPIIIGLAVKPTSDAPLQIGFSARPDGQNLTYAGTAVRALTGNVTGYVRLREGGGLQIGTRPATIRAAQIAHDGFDVTGLDITTNPIFWEHGQQWQKTGWGSFVANGTLQSLQLRDFKQTIGATAFRLGAARAESGRVQLDYQSDISSLAGTVSGGQLVLSGTVASKLDDLTQFAKAEFMGMGQLAASRFVVPRNIRTQIPSTLPPALLTIAGQPLSGSARYQYRITPTQAEISLAGPLALSSASGARVSLVPSGAAAPSFVFKTNPNGTTQFGVLAAGKVEVDVPGLGSVKSTIDGASFGSRGWAVVGRNTALQSFALLPNLTGDLRFDQFNVSASSNGPLNGRGVGQIALRGLGSAQSTSRALLGFDLRATPSSVTGTISGPVEGFGDLSRLGGTGLRGGFVTIAGSGNRRGNGWLVDGRATLRGNAMATGLFNASSPVFDVAGNGQISDTGGISLQAKLSGNAANAQASSARGQGQLGALRFDGTARINGTPNALQLSGAFDNTLSRAAFGGFGVDAATNQIQVSGLISGAQTRLTGTQSTYINRLTKTDGQPSGRVEVAKLNASGPFTLQIGQQGRSAPFWNGRLGASGTSLTSALTLDAQRVKAGGTSLTALRLSAPTSFASNGASWLGSANLTGLAQTLNAGDTRLRGVSANGPIAMAATSGEPLVVTSSQCLAFKAQSGTFPGQASADGIAGKLCPDARGQLAILSAARGPRLFATTQLTPLTIQMGGQEGGQSVAIGDVTGTFVTNSNGSLGLQMLATQAGLSIKMPDGTTAEIKANEAALDIITRADGIGLKGRVGRVSSLGLPVFVSGGATADLLVGANGLGGSFKFDDIILKDIEKSARFGEVQLIGSGSLAGNQVTITSDVLEPASQIKMGGIILSHDIGAGSGNLDLTVSDLLMSPVPIAGRPGLDIVTLIPPLRGVVSDMTGVANASANFAWSRNAPIVSRANIETKGLDFATMLGPVTGFSGDVKLDDILLVRTPGTQTIKISQFDPGLPIADGTVQFSLPGNNSLRLENASWPFAEGKLSVRPATWAFRDGDQSFSIDVEDVDLAKLLRLTEVPNLEIDGKVSGVFPIEVRNGNVEIVGGRLKAREGGGVIRYTGPSASPPPPPPGFFGRIRQRLFGKPAPAGADLAVEALRALEYKILEITVDGRITGELQMGVVLEGANQQVLSGQPFKFNIKMNVPVGQLLENLNRLNNAGSSPEVLKEIDRVMREDAARPPSPPPAPPVP